MEVHPDESRSELASAVEHEQIEPFAKHMINRIARGDEVLEALRKYVKADGSDTEFSHVLHQVFMAMEMGQPLDVALEPHSSRLPENFMDAVREGVRGVDFTLDGALEYYLDRIGD